MVVASVSSVLRSREVYNFNHVNSHVKISANIRIELAMAERNLTSPGVFEDGTTSNLSNEISIIIP